MAKKTKKTKEEIPVDPLDNVTPITDEDREKALKAEKNVLQGNVVTVPDDAIVNIPISGAFRKAIDGLLFYIMEPLTANQIIMSMEKVKKNFEGYEPEQISPDDKAIWCVMTLLTEISWQAAKQGKTVETDKKIDETVADVIRGVEGAIDKMVNKVDKIRSIKKDIKIIKDKPGELRRKKS
jgi:hypothetical protein